MSKAHYKPERFFRHVDDTFLIWSHGEEKLYEFVTWLNDLHPNVKYIMDLERNSTLAFLDVLVIRTQVAQWGINQHTLTYTLD